MTLHARACRRNARRRTRPPRLKIQGLGAADSSARKATLVFRAGRKRYANLWRRMDISGQARAHNGRRRDHHERARYLRCAYGVPAANQEPKIVCGEQCAFAAPRYDAIGTKQTFRAYSRMSALRGKADIAPKCRFVAF